MNPNNQKFKVLYTVGRILLTYTDLKSACQKVMEELSESMQMKRGLLIVYDDQTGQLAIEVTHGITSEDVRKGRFQIDEEIVGKVFEASEPMLISVVSGKRVLLQKSKHWLESPRNQIAYLCIPVKIQMDTVGVLCIDRLTGDGIGTLQNEMNLLKEIAELVGLAVKVARTETEAKRNLLETNLYLHRELKHRYKLHNVIGVSKQMQEVFALVEQVSLSKATILLRGESGTGKELIAHAIHFKSPRAEQPFIKFSCAALPETLLESELFGHEKGAFTGAVRTRPGRFELAHGGTLFLDEIGDIPLTTQTKLLRVLQERRFERLGGTRTISSDIRIVTATNRDLESAVKEKLFREDLYYRLNVVPIYIAALRDRRDDIPPLVEHFLNRFNQENGKEMTISPSALAVLQAYDWPGNVRELENTIERLIVITRHDVIEPEDIHLPKPVYSTDTQVIIPGTVKLKSESLNKTVEDIEREQIQDALRRTGGVQAKAARFLGITTRQIRYKIKKYNIVIDMTI